MENGFPRLLTYLCNGCNYRVQIWYTEWVANQAHHKITQMTKVGLGHGIVRSLQNQVSHLILFAVAEVAMAVPKNDIKQKNCKY